MTVVVWLTPPPVPLMVIVWFPSADRLPTLTVMVDVPAPGAAIGFGLKVTVWPLPCPVADKVIAELKPPVTVVVIVELPELPLETVIEVGDALMVKLGLVPVTVSETVVVATILPEVPVTVMGYVPGAVDAETVIVNTEVPAPVIEVGLKPTVTPLGCPDAVKEIMPLKPPVTVLVIVEVPWLPGATETDEGEAERLKPGPDDAPVRSLMRPDPFGLPQPVARS